MAEPSDPHEPNPFMSQPGSPPPVPPPPQTRAAYAPSPAPVPQERPRRSLAARLFSLFGWGLLALSILGNLFLLGMVAFLVRGQSVNMSTTVLQDGQKDQVVAMYTVNDVIGPEASSQFATFAREIQDDANVKAVVLRIESPGGTVSDSNQIHHRLTQLRDSGKTIVASMGGVAASGGYLICLPAEEILAEPSTVTGSIGVIAQVPNLQGTMDKIGVKMLIFKSANADRWKDALSPWRMPEDHERRRLLELLNKMQADFEQAVRAGRPTLVTKQIEYEETVGQGPDARTVRGAETAPLNGKVYLASEAKQYGLIDSIGYLDAACMRAADLAGLNKPKIVQYKPKPDLFGGMFGSQAPGLQLSAETLDTLQTPRLLMIWKAD
jgi:protease IV